MAKKKNFTQAVKGIIAEQRPQSMSDLMADEGQPPPTPKPAKPASKPKTKAKKKEDMQLRNSTFAQSESKEVERLNIQISKNHHDWLTDEIARRKKDSNMKGRRSQRAVIEEALSLLLNGASSE